MPNTAQRNPINRRLFEAFGNALKARARVAWLGHYFFGGTP
ncbi:hypothetical protein [Bradyrhizobium sp.]|nr:hypothetical protein [Bradyrhizobium sp.]